MQFSRLRLVGFKSFADSAELVIEPGLTGLVGPNGCGKSNLAEALRWVMGENSYKTIRAARGEEVIFAGTAGGGGRVAANFAEVTLYLDNSDFTAPLGYNHEAELSISRHISRDGTSQYRINGREARAKQVQFLLADQAAGAHSPAQVGQGRVGALIEAKPQARRILLEEAAGIGGLQMRREAAENRLKATDANLARLREILAELETRLAALRAQAEQAAEFRAFSSAIRRLETVSHRLQLREAGALRLEAEAALNRQTVLLAEKHEQQLRLAGKAENYAAEAEAAAQQRAAAAAAQQRLALEAKAQESERQLCAAQAQNLAESLAQISADFAREQQRQAENNAVKARQEAELKLLEAEAQPGTDAAAQDAANAAKAELETAECAFAAARQKRVQAAAAQQEQQKAAQFYAEMQARQSKKQAELEAEAEAAAKNGTAQAELRQAAAARLAEAQTECESRERFCAQAADKQAECRRRREAAAGAAEKAQLSFNAAAAALKALRQITAEFAAAELAEAGENGACIIQLSAVQKGYEAAFAAALGEASRGALNPSSPFYWRALPPLAAKPLPQGAVPLAEFVRAPQALRRALAQAGIIRDSQDGAALQAELCPGQILVNLSGDIWRWDGFTRKAGHKADIYAGYLERKRQIEEQSQNLAAESRAHKDARGFLAECDAECADAERVLQAAQQAHQQAQRKLHEAESEARRAEAEQKAGAAAQNRLAQALTELQAEARRLSHNNYGQNAAAAAQPSLAALEQAETATETACRAARNIWLTCRAEIQASEKQRQEKAARLKNLRRELTLWREREAQQKLYLAELSRRRTEAEQRRAELDEAAAARAIKQQNLAEACAQAAAAEREASSSAGKAADSAQTAAKAARKAEQELSAARETRSRLEEKLAAAQERACQAEAAAEAYWGRRLQPQDMEEELGALTRQEIERELRQKRGLREALGAVNLRAEEESDAARQHYDELKAEADDIAAAQAKLREAIADLNREGRARLRKAFAEVNARFAHLFRRLFGGGLAELQWMEDEADPLNIGLEIAVCPPGKKRQNISLLSGGEQSLTALALIFAVFLSNPAPLCVLDEVDAPLDDYNVERFCRLLREMTKLTQTRFLVISHNPISMAQMDRLFGVTMIEKGVSTLVSVDLNQAAAFAGNE